MHRHKYPRTPHLPWSPGATSDDVYLLDTKAFVGREVVCLEKMDGENTTVYADGYTHARSIDSANHPSRTRMRAVAAGVGAQGLPEALRVCGENLTALHSLWYDRLPGIFVVFGMLEGDVALSWDEVSDWASLLDLPTAPVLYRGPWDEAAVRACMTGTSRFQSSEAEARQTWDSCGHPASRFAVGQEGYVVRLAGRFAQTDFGTSVAKFVRPGHVQTDAHWISQAMIPNRILGA